MSRINRTEQSTGNSLSNRFNKYAATLTLAALGTTGVAACGGNATGPEKPPVTTSQGSEAPTTPAQSGVETTSPTSLPTIPETKTPSQEYGQPIPLPVDDGHTNRDSYTEKQITDIKESIYFKNLSPEDQVTVSKLDAMDYEAFSKQPEADQLLYATTEKMVYGKYLRLYFAQDEHYSEFLALGGDEKTGLIPPANAEDSPEVALAKWDANLTQSFTLLNTGINSDGSTSDSARQHALKALPESWGGNTQESSLMLKGYVKLFSKDQKLNVNHRNDNFGLYTITSSIKTGTTDKPAYDLVLTAKNYDYKYTLTLETFRGMDTDGVVKNDIKRWIITEQR